MLKKLRENVYLGDAEAFKSLAELKKLGIDSVMIVADDLRNDHNDANIEPRVFKMGLRSDRINPPFIKDITCHAVLQMLNNGETVLIQSKTGLERGAFVACRVICEIEARTIYEIMQELKVDVPEFEINRSYF